MHPHLSTASEAQNWLQANDIRRVELVFADLTSVARGKIMSTASFVETLGGENAFTVPRPDRDRW